MMSLPESEVIHHPKIAIPGLGTVRGVIDRVHPVAKFLNVPFGVLTERWRPADKVRPWQGVRDGTKNGYVPTTVRLVGKISHFTMAIACLCSRRIFPTIRKNHRDRKINIRTHTSEC